MSSTIKLKRSAVSNNKPTVGQLDLGEMAINTYDGKMFLKRYQQYFDETTQETTTVEDIVEFSSTVPVENTLYVQKSGNDRNTGNTWSAAFATFEAALAAAAARGTLTLIEVGPGVYETEGHLDLPDNTIIKAVHRSAFVRPKAGFEERNVFRVGSGCFIEGLVFENWRLDDLENPTEGFAVCFRPGAVITRVPYIHKVVVRTNPYWTTVAPPLDRANANPLVGRGAGVILADGAVLSPYSVFPNIMTWGATPVTHNGIGYCAKNGALINAVNAISIWAHKHFYALDGGQIILSSCSTQFGDYTLVSKGARNIIRPTEVSATLSIQTAASTAITNASSTIINNMWTALVAQGYTTGWPAEYEVLTRRDAASFMQSLSWTLQTANEQPMLDLAKGYFDTQGNITFASTLNAAFVYAFEYMRDQVKALAGVNSASDTIVDALVAALISTLFSPSRVSEPSTITAVGHTWTGIMSGVALTKIPPARNVATIYESILELDQGVVIASGQDDQGSALFIGGMEINADTGELSGPPFDTAVNRIATRAAIARSF